MRSLRTCLICWAVGLGAAATAWAQSGVVKSEGQPIPGAAVRATQGELALSTITGENGEFQFDRMTPGTWTIEVNMFGFNNATKQVQIGSTPTKIDMTLDLRPPRQ